MNKARSRTWEIVTPSRAPQRGGARSSFSAPCEVVAASFVRQAAASGGQGKDISQEAVSSVSGMQGGGSVEYVSIDPSPHYPSQHSNIEALAQFTYVSHPPPRNYGARGVT